MFYKSIKWYDLTRNKTILTVLVLAHTKVFKKIEGKRKSVESRILPKSWVNLYHWKAFEIILMPQWKPNEGWMKPKLNPTETRIELEWNPNLTRMKPEWNPNETRIEPEWNPNETRMKPGWIPNESRKVQVRCLNESQIIFTFINISPNERWIKSELNLNSDWNPN